MDQEFKLTDQEYYTETVIFGIIASLAFLFKVFACCHSLGLSQRQNKYLRELTR